MYLNIHWHYLIYILNERLSFLMKFILFKHFQKTLMRLNQFYINSKHPFDEIYLDMVSGLCYKEVLTSASVRRAHWLIRARLLHLSRGNRSYLFQCQRPSSKSQNLDQSTSISLEPFATCQHRCQFLIEFTYILYQKYISVYFSMRYVIHYIWSSFQQDGQKFCLLR